MAPAKIWGREGAAYRRLPPLLALSIFIKSHWANFAGQTSISIFNITSISIISNILSLRFIVLKNQINAIIYFWKGWNYTNIEAQSKLDIHHGCTDVLCYKLVGAITKPRPMGSCRSGFVMGYTVLLLSLVTWGPWFFPAWYFWKDIF